MVSRCDKSASCAAAAAITTPTNALIQGAVDPDVPFFGILAFFCIGFLVGFTGWGLLVEKHRAQSASPVSLTRCILYPV